MIEPIRLAFEVDVPPDHAFRTWTERIATWERLGAEGEAWRGRNGGGWSTLLPRYRAAVSGSDG